MLSPGFAADHIGKKAGVADMPGTSLPKPRIKFQWRFDTQTGTRIGQSRFERPQKLEYFVAIPTTVELFEVRLPV